MSDSFMTYGKYFGYYSASHSTIGELREQFTDNEAELIGREFSLIISHGSHAQKLVWEDGLKTGIAIAMKLAEKRKRDE